MLKRLIALAALSVLFVSGNAWSDGIDADAKVVLHMDGSDASTTFTDSSLTPKTFTAVADAQIDTAQSVFDGASGLFDGTGDALSAAYDSDFFPASNPFTIDFRIRFNSVATCVMFAVGNNNTAEYGYAFYYAGGNIVFAQYNTGLNNLVSKAWTPSANTWYHVALIRGWGGVNDDWAITIDGTQIGTTSTVSGSIPASAPTTTVRVACQYNIGSNVNFVNGWIDEFRFSKGIARWTSNFTPPTEAYSESGGASRRIIIISEGARLVEESVYA